MIYDQHDSFTRTCLSNCKAMEFFYKMIRNAEHQMNKATIREKDLEFVVVFGRLTDTSTLDHTVTLMIRLQQGFKENTFFRHELKLSNSINTQFQHAGKEKWIDEVNTMFEEIASQLFATGLFGLCRTHLVDGEFEEQDIETL